MPKGIGYGKHKEKINRGRILEGPQGGQFTGSKRPDTEKLKGKVKK